MGLALAGAMTTTAVLMNNTTANADTVVDDHTVQVEAGDTLSELAHKHGTSVDQLVKDNHIANANLIHVGDKLVVTPGVKNTANNGDTTKNSVQNSQVTTNNNNTNSTNNNATTNSSLTGNSRAALRRSIESGGNYNTNTGNGYLGAYQFAPQTIAGIESATGMKWSMDPATQDAFANYYANSRYGGWQNVPTNGGW